MILRYYFNDNLSLSSIDTFIFFFQIMRSFLEQNYFRQGCLIIYQMVMRFYGANQRHLLISYRAYQGMVGMNYFLFSFFMWVSQRMTQVPFAFKERIQDYRGGPVHASMRYIWLMVEVPGNTGLPLNISPIIHPRPHTSMALVQHADPTSISGARYHLVAIYSVNILSFSSCQSSDLTSPKSHNLASQFSFTSILDGLRSRCMSPAECKQNIALQIWQSIHFLCFYQRIFYLMSVKRSISRCSNTRQMSMLLSALITCSSFTMLGCLSSIRNMIQRQVRWASVELLKASKFFFRALTFLSLLSITFHT